MAFEKFYLKHVHKYCANRADGVVRIWLIYLKSYCSLEELETYQEKQG